MGEVFRNSCMISPLYLRHRDFIQGTSQACNNDVSDVSLHVYSLQVENIDIEDKYSCYISQLNIIFSTSIMVVQFSACMTTVYNKPLLANIKYKAYVQRLKLILYF